MSLEQTSNQDVNGDLIVVQSTAANLNATVVGTVTANIGTTGGLALNSTVAALQVLQGSTTAGESGTLVLGAATTSSPSYTTGESFPLSLTLAGALRTDASATIQPVSGTVTANAGTGNFNVIGTGTAGTPASGVVTVQGITSGTPIPISGTVTANPQTSSTATLTSVAASTTTESLLASNSSRKALSLYNDSISAVYVAFAATASSSAYSVKMQPNSFFENSILYQGAVSGIWVTATGNMRITEYT